MHFTVDPMGHRSNPLTETDDPEGELTTDVGPLTELDPDLVACDDDELKFKHVQRCYCDREVTIDGNTKHL